MKTMILLVALGMAVPAWAQAPANDAAPPAKNAAATAKPADAMKAEAAKPVAKPAPVKAAKKASARRHQDARHCLQRGDNDAIIRCAEEYL